MSTVLYNRCVVILSFLVVSVDSARAVTRMKMMAARTLQAAGLPDPTCATGIVSMKGLSGNAQVCCAGYCGECSDYASCKNVRGQDSTYACCQSSIHERRCGGGAAANVCIKSCSDAVPPCIMDKKVNFKKPDPNKRNAATDCNDAKAAWQKKAEVATTPAKKAASESSGDTAPSGSGGKKEPSEEKSGCPNGDPTESSIGGFSKPKCGRSPGGSVLSKTSANTLQACQNKCKRNKKCKAVIYRANKKTCHNLSRRYNKEYEKAKDDCVVSNKQ